MLEQVVARMPARVQRAIFEVFLRVTVMSAARCVAPSIRFALNELFQVRGVRRYTIRRSGRTLYVRHPVMDAWIVHEVIDRRVYALPSPVEQVLREAGSPRIVDVGAHIGAAMLFFLERFPTAEVTAVEANPETAVLLRRMLAVNGLEGQCEVRQVAAGVAEGSATMEGSSILAHLVRSEAHTIEVIDSTPGLSRYKDDQLRVADVEVVDIIPVLQGADLVKMDIEGAEWAILRDSRFASLDISALVLEYHPQDAGVLDTAKAVGDLLASAGFTVGEPFEQHGELGMIWAWRP